MRARLRRKSLDAIEIDDHQPGKSRQRERIKGLLALHAGKITQAQRAQLELLSLFRRRQKNTGHLAIITGTFGVRRPAEARQCILVRFVLFSHRAKNDPRNHTNRANKPRSVSCISWIVLPEQPQASQKNKPLTVRRSDFARASSPITACATLPPASD